MFPVHQPIADFDVALSHALQHELQRQEQHIELIASENYCSRRVLEAQGSVLTNKYAEGYPRKRYYGGCQYVDEAEQLAIDRACTLFGCNFANVQPHSGSSANSAAFMALCQPHDTILGMSLSHGGHLTHGAKVNFSGRLYNSVQYTTDDNGLLDFNQIEDLALKHKPKLIIAGFSAYSRTIDWSLFRSIADKVGAYLLVDMAHIAGLVATGHYPNPLPHAHVVTSTTHKTLRGPRSGIILWNDESLSRMFNGAIFPGYQGGPLMHVIAAKAVAFKEAMEPSFTAYQQNVIDNAQAMAKRLQQRDLPIVSGGTENHLMLVDLQKRGLTGKAVEKALGEAYITINKNTVPNDPQSPFVTSGIRLGTPAITTRGFGIPESEQTADWIADVIDNIDDNHHTQRTRDAVVALCERFAVYQS